MDEKTSSTGASAVPQKEADRQVAAAIGNLNDEMTFSEFTQGLAAIAVYKDPDPYLPLHQKLESFLVNSVFGKLTTDKFVAAKVIVIQTPAAKNLSSADVETKAEVAGNSEPSIDADGGYENEARLRLMCGFWGVNFLHMLLETHDLIYNNCCIKSKYFSFRFTCHHNPTAIEGSGACGGEGCVFSFLTKE